MKTIINSNGSRWAGAEPLPISELLAMLAVEPLDPRFERYGDFVTADPESAKTGKPLYERGSVMFWGNFLHVSHVFDIVTTDVGEIAALTSAIRANQKSQAYLLAKGKARQKAA